MEQRKVTSTDMMGNSYAVPISQLTWRPAAYGIVVHGGTILLIKATGKYHLPGGGVNLGELPEEAVIREVLEETGITTKNPQSVGSLSTFFAFQWGPGDIRHAESILLYFTCQYTSKEPQATSLESHELDLGMTHEWVPLDRLADIPIGSTVNWRPVVTRAVASLDQHQS